jgi:hypothetical protein
MVEINTNVWMIHTNDYVSSVESILEQVNMSHRDGYNMWKKPRNEDTHAAK